MRRPVRVSPEAENWLMQEIAALAQHSPAAAQALVGRMRWARDRLATFPEIGVRGDIPGTRRLAVTPYVLTTRPRDGAVEIAAVRQARQADAYRPAELEPDENRAPDDPASSPRKR